MILPKELQIVTKKDILEEVADELGLDIKDVNKTYDIWVKFLDYIANDTDQCTIYLPNLGRIYVNIHRLNRDNNKNTLERRLKKLRTIQKVKENSQYVVHSQTLPTPIRYGISKRNIFSKERKNGHPPPYTMDELVDKQKDKFFKEDFKYSENERIKKYFD